MVLANNYKLPYMTLALQIENISHIPAFFIMVQLIVHTTLKLRKSLLQRNHVNKDGRQPQQRTPAAGRLLAPRTMR